VDRDGAMRPAGRQITAFILNGDCLVKYCGVPYLGDVRRGMLYATPVWPHPPSCGSWAKAPSCYKTERDGGRRLFWRSAWRPSGHRQKPASHRWMARVIERAAVRSTPRRLVIINPVPDIPLSRLWKSAVQPVGPAHRLRRCEPRERGLGGARCAAQGTGVRKSLRYKQRREEATAYAHTGGSDHGPTRSRDHLMRGGLCLLGDENCR